MQVTWIEHIQYDENVVHPLFRALPRSGVGFGAKRWLASLQRQCDSLAAPMSSTIPTDNPSGMKPVYPTQIYTDSSKAIFVNAHLVTGAGLCSWQG